MAAAENELLISESPRKRKSSGFKDECRALLSSADYSCPICLQILIEPVVMPCKHELCKPCFKQNVEEANFLCPLCRMRISSWARRSARNGTLVNLKRWKEIQRLFPTKCQKRLRGEDDEDTFDQPQLKRTISKDGELRQEYEAEMRKLQQAREQEMRASEEAIRQLEEEEQRLMRSIEQQALQDEELARKMERIQNSQERERLSQQSKSVRTIAATPRSKVNKGKGKAKNTEAGSQNCFTTLDRWFSPTRQTNITGNQDVENSKDISSRACPTKSGAPFAATDNIPNYNFVQEYRQRKEQEDKDYQFALKLQKEFDLLNKKRSEVERKKGTVDAYLLRRASETQTSVNTSHS